MPDNHVVIRCEGFKECRGILFSRGKYASFSEFKSRICAQYNNNVIEVPSLLEAVVVLYELDGNIYRVVDSDGWEVAEKMMDNGRVNEVVLSGLSKVVALKKSKVAKSEQPRESLIACERREVEWKLVAKSHGQLKAWNVLGYRDKQRYALLVQRVMKVTGTKDYVTNPHHMICPICSKELAMKRICDRTGACIYGPISSNGHIMRVHAEGRTRKLAETLVQRMSDVLNDLPIPPIDDELKRLMVDPPKRDAPKYLPHELALRDVDG